ncbi:MAG: quinolinate synthase NadA [Lachnospiraceae bacterium]|nr:quinolinate synthase NadA [Lachnospiraceae bacterium]
MNNLNLGDEIRKLKEEKNAVIMCHYYVEDEVQDIADYIGDSFFLSRKATEIEADVIVLCGVRFMGESAKALNPGKVVLLPAEDADCPMAHMATVEAVEEMRKQYDDLAVVCYVNSTAELKAASDVCVTSANALKIVSRLSNKNIFFIPDQNLAHYIADQLPEKNFIFNDGYCHVHHTITKDAIVKMKEKYPKAEVLVHPECKPEVCAMADYIGSTSGIINYVKDSSNEEFIVVTERGVLYELGLQTTGKKFYTTQMAQVCPNMKKITLEKVYNALKNMEPKVEMPDELIEGARKPMEKMLELAK